MDLGSALNSIMEFDIKKHCHVNTNEDGDRFVGIKADSDNAMVYFPIGYELPETDDFTETDRLAIILENQLEETKLYVGTKQTEYEYKHKECVDTIHQIDDYINALYGLSEEEGLYIKNFAYRYRIGGGVEDERN